MTTNTDTQAHGGGVETVRRIADLLDENAECYSENAMDRAFLGNSKELAALIVEYLALAASPAAPAERPAGHVEIAHDGFSGDIIGHYETREGKRGVVVQQDGTRVVHVYGEKWLATPDAKER